MPKPNLRRAGRPTRADAENLSRAILEVAEQHFSTRGYDGTVIDQIASAAGTTKGAIYNRFGNKAGLLAAIGGQLLARHYRPIEIERFVSDDLPLEVTLREHALRMIRAGTDAEPVAYYRMLLAASPDHPEIPAMIANYASFYEDETVRFFDFLIAKNMLNVRNVRQTASLFTAIVLGKISLALAIGAEIPEWEETQRYVRQASKVFIGGIARLELEAGSDNG